MTRILGIDPSLTGTGLAFVDTNDRLHITVGTIETVGAADATLYQRRERLSRIAFVIRCRAVEEDVDLVVIEGPSLAQKAQRGTFDRAGLWWLIVDWIAGYPFPLVEVSPKGRAKYATGNGNSGKADVMAAARATYPHAAFSNDNECDALILAAMGARAIARPIDENLSAKHTDALTAVRWPDLAGLR